VGRKQRLFEIKLDERECGYSRHIVKTIIADKWRKISFMPIEIHNGSEWLGCDGFVVPRALIGRWKVVRV